MLPICDYSAHHISDGEESSSDESDAPKIDPEDPMYDYLMSKYREEKAAKRGTARSAADSQAIQD